MCITVYHNSRWGKSRSVLQLLRDNNIKFTIVEYLKEPPNIDELNNICQLLSVNPIDLIRVYDKSFKALNVDINEMNNNQILEIIAKNPKILERPIIHDKNSGVIGRPPENVKILF